MEDGETDPVYQPLTHSTVKDFCRIKQAEAKQWR